MRARNPAHRSKSFPTLRKVEEWSRMGIWESSLKSSNEIRVIRDQDSPFQAPHGSSQCRSIQVGHGTPQHLLPSSTQAEMCLQIPSVLRKDEPEGARGSQGEWMLVDRQCLLTQQHTHSRTHELSGWDRMHKTCTRSSHLKP